MPDIQKEIKDALDLQGKAFEEFKTTVNDTLKKGASETADHKAKFVKLEADLQKAADELKRCGDELDKQAKRLAEGGLDGKEQALLAKATTDFNLDRAAAFLASGKQIGAAMTQDEFTAYKAAYDNFLRRGRDGLTGDEAKTMYSGSDPAGGYVVVPDTSGRIVTRLYESSPMRRDASVQVISTDSLQGMKDLGEADCGWVGERAARPATNTPELGVWEIPVHEMYAMPEATTKLLEDARIDVAAWLGGKVGDKMARTESTAFVTGNGSGKPRGFASYSTANTADSSRSWGVFYHKATGTSGGFGATTNGVEKMIDLMASLLPAYRANAKWYSNRATMAEARKLKDGDGAFIWHPATGPGLLSTLLGFPVADDYEDMAAIGADSLSIAFGDMKQTYQIVDRTGIRVVRDELTNKPFIRFYTVKRVGGDVINFNTLRFLKFGTT